jgi:hypothetical protein
MDYFEDKINFLMAQIAQLEKDNKQFRLYINKFGVLEKLQDSDRLGHENETLKLENKRLRGDIALLQEIHTEKNKEINGWHAGVGVPRGANVHHLAQSGTFGYLGKQIGQDGWRYRADNNFV